MKAAVLFRRRGQDDLRLQEVPTPGIGPRDILIEVYASSVCRGDINLRKIPRAVLVPLGWLFGFKPMDVPGVEFAGRVHAVGTQVNNFAVGDEVLGTATGLAQGGNAEFIRVPEPPSKGVLVKKPKDLPFDEAAVLPVGLMTAFDLLKALNLKSGQSLLVYGASGSVGSAAVQIALAQGLRVTGVCSGKNRAVVEGLGVSKVLDYEQPQWTQTAGQFDGVLDAVGKLSGKAKKDLRKPRSRFTSIRALTSETAEALQFGLSLIEEGKFRPLIDRHYALAEVGAAHEYVAQGKKRGNVAIRVKA